MAIIAGNAINTAISTSRAEQVIVAMENVLKARYCHRIGRRVFIVQWARLRKRLLITPEYQDLIQRVCIRASGICESCRRRAGEHVHHKEPVAFAPRRALVDDNCIWVCEECHEDEDKLARRAALARRPHYDNAQIRRFERVGVGRGGRSGPRHLLPPDPGQGAQTPSDREALPGNAPNPPSTCWPEAS